MTLLGLSGLQGLLGLQGFGAWGFGVSKGFRAIWAVGALWVFLLSPWG